jgi:hypothetical protein
MTHSSYRLSRRNMFSVAVGGASALALGHGLMGTAHAAPTSKAAAAKLKRLEHLRAIEPGLRPGALAVPGDLKLDPQTLALAEKLLARAKQSVLVAATRPNEAPKGDKVVAAASKIVGTLRSKRVTRMRATLKQAEVQARIGPAAQMMAKEMPEFYRVELQKTIDVSKLKKPELPKWSGPLVKRIEFSLNSVKCVEETSGESGSDEILLGGSLITPSGVVKKIGSFKVSDDFDDGEAVYYDYEPCNAFPPGQVPYFIKCKNGSHDDVYRGRKLEATLLGEGIPWPATLGLVLVMGEEDPGGGFGVMLQDIYAALEKEIDKQLEKGGEAIGEAIGGDAGAAIGAALAYAAGEFLDWLVSLFNNEDDLVASKSWTIQLASPELDKIRTLSSDNLPAPAGVWASPMKKLHFNGDGGRYDMRLHWRVNT